MNSEQNSLNPEYGVPDEQELELINRHTVEPLSAQDVFCFTLTLCDNEVDRDFERFSVEALTALEPMFIGKTGIADHSMKAENQHSRIFRTWIEISEDELTSVGEKYTALKAKAYIPVNEENAQLISQIKAGIKKETSISCSMRSFVCSVCSQNLKTGACKHRKGEVYSGKVCHTVLEEPVDAYEFSFVAVPAQPRAGVTKAVHTEHDHIEKSSSDSFITLSKTAFTQLNGEIQRLEQLKRDGERYREELEGKVARLAAMAVPELEGCGFAEVCGKLSTQQLLALDKAFTLSAAKQFPLAPQLGALISTENKNNNEFII